MKIIHFCGKRGMGDIVSTLSFFLKFKVVCDCHVIFHYPPNHGYEDLIESIMKAFKPARHQVTYEVDVTWYSVKEAACKSKFGDLQNVSSGVSADPVWFFSGTFMGHVYWPFNKRWQRNGDGPIALVLNHEFYSPEHPLAEKFFSEKVNDRLKQLVDNKNFYNLGMHHTYEENIEILSRCRYVLGNEGGWTHVSNATGTPFIVTNNNRRHATNKKVHPMHPCLRTINTDDIDQFLDITSNGLELLGI